MSLAFVSDGNASDGDVKPNISDPNLKIELVFRGLDFPTTMAFIGPDDILVLEKNNGTVERITNGNKWVEATLDVDVSYSDERGMLGIAIAENETNNSNPYVFLYYTKSEMNGDEKISNSTYSVSNHLYRYELVNDSKLQNPKLLLSTPSTEKSFHQGGKLVIGPDHNIYATIGDQTRYNTTQAQNIKKGTFPDTTGGILRITLGGQVPSDDILGKNYPLNLYYAYGIRNSFGIDFDPVTGKLWDTELGPSYGDEINLVEPGFNSGWSRVQGIWSPSQDFTIGNYDITIGNRELKPDNLVYFDGEGKYSTPEFIWKIPACVTAIKFLSSDKYGKEYKDDVFVGTSTGNLYHFDLNKNRTGFILYNNLIDKIADTNSRHELSQVRFGDKFGEGITDMQVGPYDGLLYIVLRNGAIYKIVPKDIKLTEDNN
jgi:aldose sugar dehydrogenase